MLRFDERVHLPKNRENTITFLVNGEPIGTVETLAPGAKTVDIPIPTVDYDSVTDALGYVPVDKAGDTMTGDLTVVKSTDNHPVTIQANDVTLGTVPNTDAYCGLLITDSNGDMLGYLYADAMADGRRRIRLNTRNLDGSTSTNFTLGFTANGTAYCSFPDTSRCDGQWTYSNSSIASGVTWNTSSHSDAKSYSLSSYLPSDSYKYEVILRANATTTATSGKMVTVGVTSDIITTQMFVCRCRTRTASSQNTAGTVIIPVGTGRKVNVAGAGTEASADGTYDLRCLGYRRIGLNS